MKKVCWLAGCAVIALAWPARGDWDPPDPNAKWIQMPLMDGGYDVLSMEGFYPDQQQPSPVNKVVADDWQCTDSRPVTDIHVWGSWWDDSDPDPGSWTPNFRLTIYSDEPGPPSHPDTELWTKDLQPTVRLWGTGDEQFHDPNGILPLSPETQVWQYNFVLDPADYFSQTPGTIYWLSVQALNPPVGHAWGWKTSADHWNDDAAWKDVGGTWQELKDPQTGDSLDMAFVITVPEPRTYALGAGLALLGFAAWRRRKR